VAAPDEFPDLSALREPWEGKPTPGWEWECPGGWMTITTHGSPRWRTASLIWPGFEHSPACLRPGHIAMPGWLAGEILGAVRQLVEWTTKEGV
jgi:hypothetical protein